ncbi:MAG: translation initiation factor IF-2 [Tannerella sp.]|jgi:translation initiation factor IF-2|nr:translation initiation factor IF-2 [Tannerella sp.]
MPIKLFKVIKDLGIGIQTATEYLKKKGHEVESNPNVKISEEQYDLLMKEFGKSVAAPKDKFLFKTPDTANASAKKPKPKEQEVIRVEVSEVDKPKFVTKGKIDLDELSPKSKHSSFKHDKKHSDSKSHNKEKPVAKEQVVPKEVEQQPVEVVAPTPTQPEVVVPEPTPVVETVVVEKEDAPVVAPEIRKEPQPEIKAETEPEQTVEQPLPQKKEEPAEEQPQQKAATETKPDEQPAVERTERQEHPERQERQDRPERQDQKRKDLKKNKQQKSEHKQDKQKSQKEPVKSDGTAQEGEVFRIHKLPPKLKLKVVGEIDLASINPATSPRKKSKEEKRREREKRENEKREKIIEQRKLNKTHKVQVDDRDNDTSEGGRKKPRKRIRKDKVDISNTPGTNFRREERSPKQHRVKRPLRVEISDDDVQKQVKETLARLTNKSTKGKGAKYRKEKRDLAAHREQEHMEAEARESKVLKLTEFVTANDLASMMDIPVTKVISTCMSIGIMVSINQRLDAETINIVAEEFGFTTEYVSADVSESIAEVEDKTEDLVSRPPIITVMGHVDHGKTSLLDNIRNTNVIAGEAGGITQHIGAYNVKLPGGRHITFLDTPGHEAFTAMRARGAQVTDIAIIIVAADDSVMPQTVEAINHASAAGVPIVFAINKIDKPHADPEKIKRELANMNYIVEDWGGKYQSQEISAKQGIGVPELLEKVLLEADMLDLKANPNRRAVGSIIESSLDKGRGFISTILVSNGTLKQGDVVLAGTHYGRIKAMFNERNQRIKEAAPSEPAIILGLDGAPQAGDSFNVLETEQEAREIASRREQLQRELDLRTQKRYGLEELGRRRALGDFHELNLIVKGDVDGSVEAISDSLIKLSTPEIQVNVIHKAVGQISESDISLAAAAHAVIIGFQVRPSTPARRLADNDGVEIRLYSIIYDAINDVKDAMEGMLSPEIREDIVGEVEVQQVFKISKVGTIAGCIVKEGKIKRTNKVRLIRDGIVIHSGELGSLKRFKDEVKEAVMGQDCGIYINNFNDIQIGDIIEPFDQIEIKKTL